MRHGAPATPEARPRSQVGRRVGGRGLRTGARGGVPLLAEGLRHQLWARDRVANQPRVTVQLQLYSTECTDGSNPTSPPPPTAGGEEVSALSLVRGEDVDVMRLRAATAAAAATDAADASGVRWRLRRRRPRWRRDGLLHAIGCDGHERAHRHDTGRDARAAADTPIARVQRGKGARPHPRGRHRSQARALREAFTL